MKFERGYRQSRDKVMKSAKFTRSCFNCDFYYERHKREGEVCQNPNVTPFDLVQGENTIYCCFWCQSSRTTKDNNKLFGGTGRNRIL